MPYNPTPEQHAIVNQIVTCPDSLIIEARAGTGKTTTICDLVVPELKGSAILMAFNKSISKELQSRINQLPLSVQLQIEVGTVHAIGLKAYTRNHGSKPRIDGGKVNYIQKDMLKNNQRKAEYFKKATYLCSQIVGAAKNNGFGLDSQAEVFPAIEETSDWHALLEHYGWDLELDALGIDLDKAITHCQDLLTISNNQRNIIDFDDMIYLPLLLQHTIPTYANVLIDEAQDISATRRELAFRLLAPSGRMIAVGDEFQAIYGFTGADASSLKNIKRRAAASTLPLTICWRCDDAIITSAQREVPDIRVRPNAGPGRLGSVSAPAIEMALLGNLPPEKILELKPNLPRAGDAILCRLNKPNVSMALLLLRAGIPCRIEGRDLGRKLLGYVKQAEPSYQFKGLSELIVSVEDWSQRQQLVLASRERQAQAAMLQDETDALVLLAERCLAEGRDDYADLEALINDLFADDIPPTNLVTLSSVHKAKGREWPRVFILGRSDYMPFFLATQDWEMQQEQNLIYVAKTRAEKELIMISDVKSWIDGKKENR